VSVDKLYGYAGRIINVDLSLQQIEYEPLREETLTQYIGGAGLGTKYLYEQVDPDIQWPDSRNALFLGSGPLGGLVAASGTFSVATKGAMTNGASSSQANGFFGAYLRSCGFDGILFRGAAEDWTYLYVHDGTAELRDAKHLIGMDTLQTQQFIKQELGCADKDISVCCIGPAGENLVKYACIVGDGGHVAAHNGVGAVMGSKRLKAIAVARGTKRVPVKDRRGLAAIARQLVMNAKNTGDYYHWGTSRIYSSGVSRGTLPVRNYTTNIFSDHARFMGDYTRTRFEIERKPCWACPAHHCHLMKVTEGPYAGYEGEEPDYEQWAAWGSLIGQTDPGAAVVLSNEVDRLGLDNNEAGWVISWIMECYEKGLLTTNDVDGLNMSWGNVEATRAMLGRIARREGFGNVLAEGAMRAAQHVGGEAKNCAVYTLKGNSPRDHDHRAKWDELFDTCVSNTGTIETLIGTLAQPADFGITTPVEKFSPDDVVTALVKAKGSMQFEDSLGTCRFIGRTHIAFLCQAVNKATGWDLTFSDCMKVGRRSVNMMRLFNLRSGIRSELDAPSARYSSTPVDGPVEGKSIQPHFEYMKRKYYSLMGWDEKSGIPLAETLTELGLEHIVSDLHKLA